MMNSQPIQNPNLADALRAINAIMRSHDLAGAVILVSADETAFTYKMDAPWSACRADPNTPMGFRLLSQPDVDGPAVTADRLGAAVHTICQMCDFGFQTQRWMTDLKGMLTNAGIAFEHTPFGDADLPHLGALGGDVSNKSRDE